MPRHPALKEEKNINHDMLFEKYHFSFPSRLQAVRAFNPFTPKRAKFKTEEIILNVILNGHTLGFHPQTQKYNHIILLTPGLTGEITYYKPCR